MKTFVRTGDRLDNRLAGRSRSRDHDPYEVSARGRSAPVHRVCKRRWTFLRCGVLLFFLAVVFPVSEGKATNPVDEFGFLSQETTDSIQRELGIKPFYILVFNQRGLFTIGVPPGSEIQSFEDQFELWRTKQEISVKEILNLDVIRFRLNPLQQCFPYALLGSLRWYCITLPN